MRRLLPVVILLSAAPALLHGGEDGAGAPSILTNSPFLPPGYQPPGAAGGLADAPASPSQYEFHGVYQLGGTYYFNLFDARERKGSWISMAKPLADWPRILRYNEEDDVLVVEVGGEQVSLNLVETSDKQLPVAQAAPPQPRPTIQAAPPAQPGQATAPPRRRVIRPTVRPAEPTPAVRRPTLQPPPQQ